MAEITITQDTIEFSKVKDSGIFTASGKYSRSTNNDSNVRFDISMNGDEISKSINAVEIDWNGAQIDDNVMINSTGDLIRLRRWFAKTA